MTTTSELVVQYLEKRPFLSELLNEGLINGSALARKMHPYIEKESGKEVSESSILMAIRRTPTMNPKFKENRIRNVLSNAVHVTVRSNIVAATYFNSSTLPNAQQQIISKLEDYDNPFFNLSRGSGETTIMYGNSMESLFTTAFKGERLKAKRDNLAAVSLVLPEVNRDIAGVYYYLIRQIAWNGINIVEVVSTSNEFIILVSQDEVQEAFAVLMAET